MSNQDKFQQNAEMYAEGNVNLLVRKNKQYGGENILQTGVHGVAVRLMDKVNRAFTMTKGTNEPEFESIYDTFQDIANYGVIGQMLLNNQWPGQEQNQPTIEKEAPKPGPAWTQGPDDEERPAKARTEDEAESVGEFHRLRDVTDLPGICKSFCTVCFAELKREQLQRERAILAKRLEKEQEKLAEGQQQLTTTQTAMVYLGGPIDMVSQGEALGWRGDTAAALADKGFASFNPAAAIANGNADREAVQSICLDAIKVCSALIAYLPSGQPAFGTIVELTLARTMGLEVVIVSDWVDKSIFSDGFLVVPTLQDAVEHLTKAYGANSGQ